MVLVKREVFRAESTNNEILKLRTALGYLRLGDISNFVDISFEDRKSLDRSKINSSIFLNRLKN